MSKRLLIGLLGAGALVVATACYLLAFSLDDHHDGGAAIKASPMPLSDLKPPDVHTDQPKRPTPIATPPAGFQIVLEPTTARPSEDRGR